MTRTDFTQAYRAARVSLNTFASSEGTQGQYARQTREAKQEAEARWTVGVNDSRTAPAYKAVVGSKYLDGSIANAAIHDYRFCGGHRKAWYLRMAREKRAGKQAEKAA